MKCDYCGKVIEGRPFTYTDFGYGIDLSFCNRRCRGMYGNVPNNLISNPRLKYDTVESKKGKEHASISNVND